MRKDAIEKIEQLVKDTQAIVKPSGEQQGVYFLRQPDGTYQERRAELDPTGATLHTIQDFVTALAEVSEVTTVFVNDQGATALAENGHIRWTFTLPLPVHPVFALLEKMRDSYTAKQKPVVRLLRTQLAGYVPDSIIENLRLVKTSSSSQSEALTTQGNKHVDLSIRRAATLRDGNTIPEFFTWDVPVFDLPELVGILQPVTVLLDVEPAERADDTEFTLTPRHDDLRRARQRVLDELVKQIRTHQGMPQVVTVLRGTYK